jgi:hypothetical protein
MFISWKECQALHKEMYVLHYSTVQRCDTYKFLRELKENTRSRLKSRYVLNNINKSLASLADNSIQWFHNPVIGRMNLLSNLVPYFVWIQLNTIIHCKPDNMTSCCIKFTKWPTVAMYQIIPVQQYFLLIL